MPLCYVVIVIVVDMLSFESLLKIFLLTPLKFLIICLAVLVPIVNAINILTHEFGCNIDLFFSYFYFLSYLALALKINLILHPHPCVNVYLMHLDIGLNYKIHILCLYQWSLIGVSAVT